MEVTESTKTATERSTEPEPYSAAWWEQRTTVELREIIKRGFGVGQAFDGAVAETERRAREAMRRVRDQAGAEVQQKEKSRLLVLGTILAVLIALVLLVWLVR